MLGRRIAYVSSGKPEKQLFVQELAGGRPVEIFSAPELNYLRWSPDGKELFFNPAPGQHRGVSVTTRPTVAFGNPVNFPRPWVTFGAAYARECDITPDGRFLGVVATSQKESGETMDQIEVVLNWHEELKQRVPAN